VTPLARILADRIAAQGPMRVADYMATCLLHPELGYYSTRDPFGRGGDFTTAPEISQMFGELIGLSLAQSWLDQGRPAPIVLAELGPGRGTMMADMLRASRAVAGFHEALDVHLVEASPGLRARQRKTLAGTGAHWHAHLAELPDGPLFLVANEFFDALPIRQFQRTGDGWRERMVGLDGAALAFELSRPMPPATLAGRLADTREGDIVETCTPAASIASEIAARLAAAGRGVAVFVDYGGWHALGDTFQALRAHRPESPLAHPGEADLTAHVDFEALAHAGSAAGASLSGLTPQGVLLERLGITARARALARGLAGSALASHIAAHRRLTHPQEMGTLFKAIALYPQACPPPPGFDP